MSAAARRSWHAPVEMPGGLGELSLRLVPAPGCGQDAAVVGAAEGGDHIPALHEVRSRTHPLIRARDVIDELTCPEEPTEDRVHCGELGKFASAGRRQRLVGQDEPLLDRS